MYISCHCSFPSEIPVRERFPYSSPTQEPPRMFIFFLMRHSGHALKGFIFPSFLYGSGSHFQPPSTLRQQQRPSLAALFSSSLSCKIIAHFMKKTLGTTNGHQRCEEGSLFYV
ncbi:hypothetical protein VIGAN_08337600 [Vigna angularis var. angularis]|uniref:Uncharacterized protein n=1 Tax=Vigna angularis var. angularis TaxID=157739 RepID=A0A0S3SUA7_PHAAN|nr:hypothetical protein VIGAN_08337600 [Vigna angularis var. angularis]